MADPRYKQGVFQGNGYQHRRRLGLTANLDTPLLHGWHQVREVDGYSVFALTAGEQAAEMRMTTPAERARWPYDWLARIGPSTGSGQARYYGFTGSLAEITAEVKAMLAPQIEEVAR